jgi:hypothetical protein
MKMYMVDGNSFRRKMKMRKVFAIEREKSFNRSKDCLCFELFVCQLYIKLNGMQRLFSRKTLVIKQFLKSTRKN